MTSRAKGGGGVSVSVNFWVKRIGKRDDRRSKIPKKKRVTSYVNGPVVVGFFGVSDGRRQ